MPTDRLLDKARLLDKVDELRDKLIAQAAEYEIKIRAIREHNAKVAQHKAECSRNRDRKLKKLKYLVKTLVSENLKRSIEATHFRAERNEMAALVQEQRMLLTTIYGILAYSTPGTMEERHRDASDLLAGYKNEHDRIARNLTRGSKW